MFNGYYKQMMYNELLIHHGETGQIILPVLRPGNSHSNRWFTHILKIIVAKIREKHQEFIGPFSYKAESWEKAQNCFAKVESTGKGLNVRYFSSNMEGLEAKELYWDFYVKRGDSSENRIK